ncbi:MAG: hypothetical protein JWP83_5413 [Mycobacterium sp.]|jgi:2-methylcitrate dehydratase|nr:hypothetical protein [Mycobacterium sp.]
MEKGDIPAVSSHSAAADGRQSGGRLGQTRRYHSTHPAEQAFGARAEVTLKSGEVISDELAVADAHQLGARPFRRPQHVRKLTELTDGVVEAAEQRRFLSAVESLAELEAVDALNVVIDPRVLNRAPVIPPGIFR